MHTALGLLLMHKKDRERTLSHCVWLRKVQTVSVWEVESDHKPLVSIQEKTTQRSTQTAEDADEIAGF